jgi:predicted nucleotidyltransferase
MKLLVKTIYGSKLFGTALPTSDTDLKAVFVCDMEGLVFNKTDAENTVEGKGSQKVEFEAHHISNFCRMLKQGQTLAYSMLFTPKDLVVSTSDAWEELVENKARLVSKNLRPFVGYARSQAQKYSLKGERLATLDHFIEDIKMFLDEKEVTPNGRLYESAFCGLMEHYKDAEGARLWTEHTANMDVRHIEICGKSFGETTPLKLWVTPLMELRSRYGGRSQQAKEDKGIDLKAMYHAVRITSEMNEILTTGSLTYPRPEAPLLMDIRNGKLTNREVGDIIDRLICTGDELFETSTLRDKPDAEWLDDWQLRTQGDAAFWAWSNRNAMVRPNARS